LLARSRSTWNFATGQITGGQLAESIPGMLLAIVMGGPLAVLGWVIVFARIWVELDLAGGEAVEVRHWLLFQTRRRWKLADVQAVALSPLCVENGLTYYA
jgi:hypothetical protein